MSAAGIVITALSTVLVAAITACGGWLVARQGRKAQEQTNAVTAESDELTAFRTLASDYRSRLETLEGREESLHARMSHMESNLRSERLKREGMARELERERERMSALEARFRQALHRIQRLLAILAEHNIEVPPDLKGDDLP